MGTFVKTNNYFFIFNENCPKEWIHKLPKEAESRWYTIRKMLQLNTDYQSKKPLLYLVGLGIGSQCYGSTTLKGISCVAPRDSLLEVPFIHEEAHAVILCEWGKLSSFFSEGLAYYIEQRIRDRTSEGCISQDKEYELTLNYLLTSMKYETFYDDEIFWYQRENGLSMYAIASNFIHFYVTRFGWNEFHMLLGKIRDDKNYLQIFIYKNGNDIKKDWIEFLTTDSVLKK